MIELQVQDAVADLLGAALVPVLRADVAAGAPRDVHLGLVGVAALILVVVMLYRSEGLCGGKEVPFLRIKRSSLYEQPLFGRKKNDTSKK